MIKAYCKVRNIWNIKCSISILNKQHRTFISRTCDKFSIWALKIILNATQRIHHGSSNSSGAVIGDGTGHVWCGQHAALCGHARPPHHNHRPPRKYRAWPPPKIGPGQYRLWRPERAGDAGAEHWHIRDRGHVGGPGPPPRQTWARGHSAPPVASPAENGGGLGLWLLKQPLIRLITGQTHARKTKLPCY